MQKLPDFLVIPSVCAQAAYASYASHASRAKTRAHASNRAHRTWAKEAILEDPDVGIQGFARHWVEKDFSFWSFISLLSAFSAFGLLSAVSVGSVLSVGSAFSFLSNGVDRITLRNLPMTSS